MLSIDYIHFWLFKDVKMNKNLVCFCLKSNKLKMF